MVCAPISLLPQLKATAESTAKQNLEKVDELAGSKRLQELKGKDDAGQKSLCENEKVSTRQKLLALNHGLNFLLQYRLSDSMPSRTLRPAKAGESRHYVVQDGLNLAFLWNGSTKKTEWQSTHHAGFAETVRLSTLQDEGDSVAAQSLANHGLSVMIHRDSMHKLHREECLAAQDVPETSLVKKQILLIVKYDKAPWKTSSFGRRLAEAKSLVGEVSDAHSLLEFVGPGVLLA